MKNRKRQAHFYHLRIFSPSSWGVSGFPQRNTRTRFLLECIKILPCITMGKSIPHLPFETEGDFTKEQLLPILRKFWKVCVKYNLSIEQLKIFFYFKREKVCSCGFFTFRDYSHCPLCGHSLRASFCWDGDLKTFNALMLEALTEEERELEKDRQILLKLKDSDVFK